LARAPLITEMEKVAIKQMDDEKKEKVDGNLRAN
jgi:hypothetical protein